MLAVTMRSLSDKGPIRQIVIMGLAISIGISVPESYAEHPWSVVIIGCLIYTMITLWQLVLGSSELDIEKFCVSDSALSNIEHRTSSHILCFAETTTTLPKIISGSIDSPDLKVQSLDDGSTLLAYKGHKHLVSAVVMACHRNVVSGCTNGSVHIWNVETGCPVQLLHAHTNKIIALNVGKYVCSDGPGGSGKLQNLKSVLISCCAVGNAVVWALDSGRLLENHIFSSYVLNNIGGYSFVSAAVSLCPHAELRIALGQSSGHVFAWNISKKNVVKLVGHYGPIMSLTVQEATSNPLVISSSADWTVRVWEFDSGVHVRILQGHSGSVDCVALLGGCLPLVVTAGKDATVRVWELNTGELIRTLEGHTQEVLAIAVPRFRSTCFTSHVISVTAASTTNCGYRHIPRIVSSGSDQSIRVWDLDRIVRDIKWARRKQFAFFVSHVNKKSQQYDVSRIGPNLCSYSCFNFPDIRMIIASYL